MAVTTNRRPDPDQLLRQVQAEERDQARGRLKVFLGYSSGVGKSFRMLDEGRRRKERGQDVVVGAVQPKAPPEVAAILRALEVIPLIESAGAQAMDVEAILRRHPQVCLVDGLAYDNPPGRPHAKRWQDVEQLLAAGINVITTVNLQYIEERREEVEKITGKRVTQTVPQSFIGTADEITIVDAPADLCMERALEDGARQQQQQLSELREITLVLAADVVDMQLETYLREHGIEQRFGTQERILICITPRTNPSKMLESGRRTAERFHGDLIAAYVQQPDLSAADREALEKNLEMARAAGAEIEMLDGEDAISTIQQFALGRGITQIFVGHSMREGRFSRSAVDRLLEKPQGIDIRVFPH